VLDLPLGSWRCLNERCSFVERLLSVAAPMARCTVRVAEIVQLFGYAAGGLPSERLLARLAIPVSDNAILRQLKRQVRERADPAPLRAIALTTGARERALPMGRSLSIWSAEPSATLLLSRPCCPGSPRPHTKFTTKSIRATPPMAWPREGAIIVVLQEEYERLAARAGFDCMTHPPGA
jgi:hypothetical protein